MTEAISRDGPQLFRVFRRRATSLRIARCVTESCLVEVCNHRHWHWIPRKSASPTSADYFETMTLFRGLSATPLAKQFPALKRGVASRDAYRSSSSCQRFAGRVASPCNTQREELRWNASSITNDTRKCALYNLGSAVQFLRRSTLLHTRENPAGKLAASRQLAQNKSQEKLKRNLDACHVPPRGMYLHFVNVQLCSGCSWSRYRQRLR